MKNRNTILLILASLAFFAVLLVNYWANALPINGLSTGDVSDLYPNLFTPAGLTFSIWGLIYLLLAVFLVAAWANREKDSIGTVLPWFFISCLLNIIWIYFWHYLMPGLSVVIMLTLLVTLIRLFLLINTQGNPPWWISLPFTIYLSWICVATIANIAAWLVSLDWNGGTISPEVWTIVMMIIAAVLGIIITIRFKRPAFAGVVAWALLGIYLRWRLTDYTALIYTAIALIVVMAVTSLFLLVRTRRIYDSSSK